MEPSCCETGKEEVQTEDVTLYIIRAPSETFAQFNYLCISNARVHVCLILLGNESIIGQTAQTELRWEILIHSPHFITAALRIHKRIC